MKRCGLGKFVTQAQAIWELEKKMDVLKRRRKRGRKRRRNGSKRWWRRRWMC